MNISEFMNKYKGKRITRKEWGDCWIVPKDLVEDEMISVDSNFSGLSYMMYNKQSDIWIELSPSLCIPKDKCTCGAKHTSRPNYHLEYCDIK